ncbi:26676_t:CDS:2, partial [Gigaspora margarita]
KKLEAKEEKLKKLQEIEANLADLKTFGGKVARNAAVGAAIVAIGPLSISIGAAIVAEDYAISQLALESIELGCLEKDGFVAKLLMLLV